MRLLLNILSILWGLLLVLVGGRFLLLLVGANRDASLVRWVLDKSNFWVEPFFGILRMADRTVGTTGGTFEVASLFAFIVYAAVGAVLFWALTFPFRGDGFFHRGHHPLGI
jgi:hypothetical protein